MLERYMAQHLSVVDKYVNPSSDYSMTVRDYVVRPVTTGGAVTVTLPAVSEAAGRIYAIVARNGTTNAVTITDNDDSEDWTDISLATNGAAALLYSDGLKWFRMT